MWSLRSTPDSYLARSQQVHVRRLRSKVGGDMGRDRDVDSDEGRALLTATGLLDELIAWFGAPDWEGPQVPVDLARRIAAFFAEPDTEAAEDRAVNQEIDERKERKAFDGDYFNI